MASRSGPSGVAKNLKKNKKRHGWTVLIWIFGTLFPPIAVALRFGFGSDFWLNLLLTICGYIPGHVHNFYIQNIRNNKTHGRTPKWAIRYGLVDDTKLRRNAQRSQWADRYNEDGAIDYERRAVDDGETPEAPRAPRRTGTGADGQLWTEQDETYYGQNNRRRSGAPNASNASLDSDTRASGGRWHYPANFDDATEVFPDPPKSKGKKDRWARAEEARLSVADDGKKKKKKKSRRSTGATDDSGSYAGGPEDPVGGAYGSSSAGGNAAPPASSGRDNLAHDF